MLSVLVLFVTLARSVSVDPVPTYAGEIVYQGEFPDVIVHPTDFSKIPVPSSWDWRKLGLLTADLNQHIPQYW